MKALTSALLLLIVLVLAAFGSGCAACSERHPCRSNSAGLREEPVSKPVCLYSCSDLMCSYKASGGGLIYAGYTDQVPLCKPGK